MKAEEMNVALDCYYTAVKETVVVESLGVCKTYGIVCTYLTAVGQCEHVMIHDVSTDKKMTKKMAKQFTAEKLPVCHLQDAVEDLLP